MARSRMMNESRLKRKLRRFPKELTVDVAAAIKQGAEELRDEIEDRAPKDEGKLAPAATARVSQDGLSAKIGYSARQAGFKRAWKKGGFTSLWQEFGTKHHAANPFIRPAFRAKLAAILNRVDAAVTKTLNKASSGQF